MYYSFKSYLLMATRSFRFLTYVVNSPSYRCMSSSSSNTLWMPKPSATIMFEHETEWIVYAKSSLIAMFLPINLLH